MNAAVILTPDQLQPSDVRGRTVVVFDVLRATTTIAAMLAAGVDEIRIFATIDSARAAGAAHSGSKLLCGEVSCLPPPGFDRGNSPRDWITGDFTGRQVFLSTTNGTRAIAAASVHTPAMMLAGALVNASVVAVAAAKSAIDVTLLCAGTAGRPAMEDLIGAGAVLQELVSRANCNPDGDMAQIALRLFNQAAAHLPAALRQGAGGRNLLAVNMDADIDYCARLNALSVVGEIHQDARGLACRRLAS